ncbi:hypothetical protein D3C76_434070 [compost metagenome]
MSVIQTNRLILRQYNRSDFDEIYSILSDPVTMSFWPKPFDKEQVTHWIERNLRSYEEHGFGRWLVVLKEKDVIIGDCGVVRSEINNKLEYDLGYIIDKDYWNLGFGTEAAEACLSYAFKELHLDSICINMPTNHSASRRVAELLGLSLESEFVNSKNRNILTYLYRIDKEEFIANQ